LCEDKEAIIKMIKKIILDTNFLLIPAQFRVDIFSEINRICHFNYQLYILDKTIGELEKIIQSRQKGKNKAAAKLALVIIKKKKIKTIKTESEEHVDILLLKENAIIATQDMGLIKRLKEAKKKIIRLRQKKYLVLD